MYWIHRPPVKPNWTKWLHSLSAGIPIVYIIRDDFTDTRAPGSVGGTPATPGPGTRMVRLDSGNKLSVNGGWAVLDQSGVSRDPRFDYGIFTRKVGDIYILSFNRINNLDGGLGHELGLDSNTSGAFTHALVPSTFSGVNGYINVLDNAPGWRTALYGQHIQYWVFIVLRATGAQYFIQGGDRYSNPTLIAWTEDVSTSPLYFAITTANSLMHLYSVRKPDVVAWLASPVLSDGFSGAGLANSDGLGHAETSGTGSGGDGIAWADQIGTATNSGGSRKAATLSGGLQISTFNAGTPDVILTTYLTRSGGSMGICARYIDSNNYLICYHDGTNIKLDEVIGGVTNNLISSAVAFTAGGRLRLSIGHGIMTISFKNSNQFLSVVSWDSSLDNATLHGHYSTDILNTFDNFTCYAKGTEGQYI